MGYYIRVPRFRKLHIAQNPVEAGVMQDAVVEVESQAPRA